MFEIQLKRAYEPALEADGFRLLVDRLWPRGVSKEKASLTEWAKDLAPSPELRKAFCHQAELMETFRVQYALELDHSDKAAAYVPRIREMLARKPVTLVYGAKDPLINHAVVLKAWLEDALQRLG